MATVTSILLVIIIVGVAIVLSQHDSAKRTGETSSGNLAQQLQAIDANQRQLIKMMRDRDSVIERLQEEVQEFIDVLHENRQQATPSEIYYYLVPNSTELQVQVFSY